MSISYEPPNPEDFRLINIRPPCPFCNEDMIHVEVRREDGNHYHGWFCDCEPQPGNLDVMIRDLRESGDKAESLIFGDESLVKPPGKRQIDYMANALKTAIDALEYIAGEGESALDTICCERTIARQALKKIEPFLEFLEHRFVFDPEAVREQKSGK